MKQNKVIRLHNPMEILAEALTQKIMEGEVLKFLSGEIEVKVKSIQNIEEIEIDGIHISGWLSPKSTHFVVWIREGPYRGLHMEFEAKKYRTGQQTKCSVMGPHGMEDLDLRKEYARQFINDLLGQTPGLDRYVEEPLQKAPENAEELGKAVAASREAKDQWENWY